MARLLAPYSLILPLVVWLCSGCGANPSADNPLADDEASSARTFLDERVDGLHLEQATMWEAVSNLRELGFRICFERIPSDHSRPSQAEPRMTASLQNLPLRKVLDKLTRMDRRYRWEPSQGKLVNVVPVESVTDGTISGTGRLVTYAELLTSQCVRDRGISLPRFGLVRKYGPLDLLIAQPEKEYRLRQLLAEVALADECGVWTVHPTGPGSYELEFYQVRTCLTSGVNDFATFLADRYRTRANERKEEAAAALRNLDQIPESQRTVRSLGIKLVYAILEEDLAFFQEHLEGPTDSVSDEELVGILSRHFERSDYREFRISDVFDLESISANFETKSRCTLRIPVRITYSKGKLELPNPIAFELHQTDDGGWHLASLTIDPVGGEFESVDRSDRERQVTQ